MAYPSKSGRANGRVVKQELCLLHRRIRLYLKSPQVSGHHPFSNGGANNCYVGIEIDSANNIPAASVDQPAGNNNKGLIATTYVATPTGAYRYAKMMFTRSAGTLTAWADGPRLGASADPALTYLTARVMV